MLQQQQQTLHLPWGRMLKATPGEILMQESIQPKSKSGAATKKSFLSPHGDALDSPSSPKFTSAVGCSHSKLFVMLTINSKMLLPGNVFTHF